MHKIRYKMNNKININKSRKSVLEINNNYLEETRPALTLASLNVHNVHSVHPLVYGFNYDIINSC